MTLRGGRRARPRTYIRKRSPMARTLLDKVWEAHTVRTLPSGQTQLLIGLHLIHEVTTPQAFQMLKELKLKVRMPERTFGTLDHIIPTADQTRPYADPQAEEMAQHMYRNMKEFGLPLFDMASGKQGIVHVIGPELGLSQPGMTIACGDSHTSTHGAVGAIAFGIGTTQVRDVLATQCLSMAKPKLRQVRVEGTLARGVYAKDVILAIINKLGVKGGVGYAYEYAGDAIERMTMEERLTVCNMSIEGGARFGYVNPDATTIEYLRGKPYAPAGAAFDGSCTTGRLSDLRIAAEVAKKGKVAKGVRALIVPGSQQVARAAEAEGLHEIFQAAGFEWRKAGCSMCLGMNPDKLEGREMSASSSNRNFIGRQGSPTGRTLLMSPAMVAAAAIAGEVTDVREILR